MLILTTLGRRCGKRQAVPLLYLEIDHDLVAIASYGGRPHHPDWFRNLEAQPEAEAQIRGARRPVRASVTEGQERDDLWQAAVAAYEGYAAYQRKAGRIIPVVVLEAA